MKKYFERKYNIVLKHPESPVVNVGTLQDPVWIPPELCTVMPGQMFRRRLDEHQTSEMINYAARQPTENAKSIEEGLGLMGIWKPNDAIVNKAFSSNLEVFGLKVDQNMVTVFGRIPKPPSVKYGKIAVPPGDASWNMAGKKFADSETLANWSYLRIGQASVEQQGLDAMSTAFENYGLGKAKATPA